MCGTDGGGDPVDTRKRQTCLGQSPFSFWTGGRRWVVGWVGMIVFGGFSNVTFSPKGNGVLIVTSHFYSYYLCFRTNHLSSRVVSYVFLYIYTLEFRL